MKLFGWTGCLENESYGATFGVTIADNIEEAEIMVIKKYSDGDNSFLVNDIFEIPISEGVVVIGDYYE